MLSSNRRIKIMTIWLIKDNNVFKPMFEIDRQKASKIPRGEENLFEIKRVRNPDFHKKYFKMVKMAFENQDEYNDFNRFRKIYQMKAGYHEFVETDKGGMYWPLSIAFDKLDEIKFQELYNKVWAEFEKDFGFDELFKAELAGFS